MTDEMRAREEAICEVAGIKDIGDLSDDEDNWMYDHDSIVAWMPFTMPEPYKVEEQDG